MRGGRVLGDWPGLEERDSMIGPGGLKVLVDYRSVLAEVLTGPMTLSDARPVFPDFEPQSIGLFA